MAVVERVTSCWWWGRMRGGMDGRGDGAGISFERGEKGRFSVWDLIHVGGEGGLVLPCVRYW